MPDIIDKSTESRIQETPEVQAKKLLAEEDPKLVISGFDNKPAFPQEVKKLVKPEPPELLQAPDINPDTLKKLLTTTKGRSQVIATGTSLEGKVDRYAKALGILRPDSPQARQVISETRTAQEQLGMINDALHQSGAPALK